MEVAIHAAAEEYRGLPGREQDAMDNAIAKLQALGERLGYPHSSDHAPYRSPPGMKNRSW